ncbi:MAG: hypothetical protein ABEH43_07735 [Flavobacteriales bacterium]
MSHTIEQKISEIVSLVKSQERDERVLDAVIRLLKDSEAIPDGIM